MDEVNDCASERRASSLLEFYAERRQLWTQSIKHREACRIDLIHLNYSIYLKYPQSGSKYFNNHVPKKIGIQGVMGTGLK